LKKEKRITNKMGWWGVQEHGGKEDRTRLERLFQKGGGGSQKETDTGGERDGFHVARSLPAKKGFPRGVGGERNVNRPKLKSGFKGTTGGGERSKTGRGQRGVIVGFGKTKTDRSSR